MRRLVALLLFVAALSMAVLQAAQPTARPPSEGIGFERTDWDQTGAAQMTTVRTRSAAAFLAVIPAALLFVLYVYRPRPYLLAWVTSWVSIAAMLYFLMIGADMLHTTPPAAGGRGIVGLAHCLGLIYATLLALAARWFRAPATWPPRTALLVGSGAVGLLVASQILDAQVTLAVSYVLIAGVLTVGASRYIGVARRYRLVGPLLIALGLFTVAGTDVYASLLVGRGGIGVELPNSVIFVSMTWHLIITLGMHLTVFEDMTAELRDTNTSLAQAEDDLRSMVVTDPLTGCYNRRFFDEVVRHELQHHRRHKLPLSLLFVDCDRFKAVNDTRGHEMGDKVLQLIASILQSRVRQADYVFRWGGDEFLVMLSCDEESAQAIADEVRESFRRHPLTRQLPEGTDLSLGCIGVPPDTRDLMPLIQAADARMYADKRRLA